jgi:ABC-type Mn2+/Zn2+ transport system permease subunit
MTAAVVASGVWDALSEPWDREIMQRALVEIVLLGAVGGALGCWIIFYSLAYSAESLSHALFPGLALAAVTGIPLIAGAAIGLVAAAVGIVLAGRVAGIGPETAIAIVISSMLGLGVVIALSPASPSGIQGLLFGDILGTSNLDLGLAAGLALVVAVALWALHDELLAVGFERSGARALGGRALLVDAALLMLLALAILVAVQGLGNLLVLAILIGPAATARLVAGRMAPMMALAVALGVACGAGGLYMSYYADTAAGASIAAVIVAVYLLVLCATAAQRTARA